VQLDPSKDKNQPLTLLLRDFSFSFVNNLQALN
jgi:hypothetical protein